MVELKLPELGEGIEKAVVACVHVKEGDAVTAAEDVLEVVTDKATFNVAAGADGKVGKILVRERDEISVGTVIALIDPA